MLTDQQIAAGHKVKQTLNDVERAQRQHHRALAELADAFATQMPDADYQAFGGGTNKDPEGE